MSPHRRQVLTDYRLFRRGLATSPPIHSLEHSGEVAPKVAEAYTAALPWARVCGRISGMAGSPAFDAPQRTEIDLVVLFFGADLKSEAKMVRDMLPAMASWCSEQGLHLQVHSQWPEDTAQHDKRPGDFAETPIGKLRDLVTDKDVFVFAIIGPDMPDADVALLKFVWNARPGDDRRVRYVFLPRPGGDAEAVRSLFAALWYGAHVYFYSDPTHLQGIEWLAKGLGSPRTLTHTPGTPRPLTHTPAPHAAKSLTEEQTKP